MSTNEAILFFLQRANADLITTIEKLTTARNNPLLTRYFTIVEAAVAYVSYLANLQVAGGETATILDLIKTVLPEFDESGLDGIDLLFVYFLLVNYCDPDYELECLVDLASGDLMSSDEYAVWQSLLINKIEPAVSLKLIDAIEAIVPTFDENNIQGWTSRQIFDGAPFTYDREGAAQLAITRSQDNFEQANNGVYFFKAGTGNQLTGVPLGVSPGPAEVAEERFRYSTLTHQAGSTGSAYFISEMLHVGGKLPMFVCDSDSPNCDPLALVDVINMWLARCGNGPNLEATSSWRDHRFLMGYFVQEHGSAPLSADNADMTTRLRDTVFWRHPDNITSLANANALDQYSSLAFDDALFVADDLNRYMDFRDSLETGGDWKQGAQLAGSAYLLERFSADGLEDINTGDYMFVDLGSETSSHGFLIVGWGDAVNSTGGINADVGRNNFSIERQSNKIPYVADFAYGYNGTNTGFLQDIRPRPFYNVIAPIINSQLQQVIGNLGSARNNFTISQLSDYTARLQGSGWGTFRLLDGSLPNLRFFKFTDTSNNLLIPFKQLFRLQLPC